MRRRYRNRNWVQGMQSFYGNIAIKASNTDKVKAGAAKPGHRWYSDQDLIRSLITLPLPPGQVPGDLRPRFLGEVELISGNNNNQVTAAGLPTRGKGHGAVLLLHALPNSTYWNSTQRSDGKVTSRYYCKRKRKRKKISYLFWVETGVLFCTS